MFRRKAHRRSGRKFSRSRTRSLHLEVLPDRRMLAAFTVSHLDDGPVNSADDLPGSLRQAIFDANLHLGADTIEFSSELAGAIALEAGELGQLPTP